MFGLMRERQLDKVKKTLRDVVSYTDEVVRDERLRAHVRSAAAHGAKASQRVSKDVDGGGITRRLADDKKLRKTLHAMATDLEDAARRMRRKKRHRMRNAIGIVAASAAGLVVVSKGRHWLSRE